MSTYRDRVKACHLCGEDVEHTGKVKSVPAYIYPSKCTVLFMVMQPELVDHSRQQVSLLTGEEGKALHAALNYAGLEGDPRIGFTSIIKCKLIKGNVKRRCAKMCDATWIQEELELIKPKIIVLVGMETVKHVLPDVAAQGNVWNLEGRPFLHFDQWYFITRDLKSILHTGKTYKKDENRGEYFGLALALKKLREMM